MNKAGKFIERQRKSDETASRIGQFRRSVCIDDLLRTIFPIGEPVRPQLFSEAMKEYHNDRNWTAGFYHSKSDPSIFVPSRSFPLSFCPNLGRPAISLSLTVLMLVAVAATWLYAPRLFPELSDMKYRAAVIVAELALLWLLCRSLWRKQ